VTHAAAVINRAGTSVWTADTQEIVINRARTSVCSRQDNGDRRQIAHNVAMIILSESADTVCTS